jgi:hypothetical protein
VDSRQPGSRFGVTPPPGFYSRLVGFILLLTALVNAGNMVSIDPKRRLQQSRSWWTSAPEVSAHGVGGGYPGRDGIPRTTFGMGHGLILMPADMAAAAMLGAAGRLTPLSDHVAEGAREVLAAFFSQAFIGSAAALFAYLLLRRMGFPHGPSALGVLSLLLATTFLHYLQNCQENNLMLACALAGAHFIALWLRNERPRDAALAGAAFGYAFLIRPTTLADTGGAMVFLFLSLRWTSDRTGDAVRRWLGFARSFLPVLAAFVFIERLYQYARFGNWLGTYWGSVPLPGSSTGGWMFGGNFRHGIGAALWSPDSSIFLFDPLLALSLAMLAAFWKKIDVRVRAFAAGAVAALAVHLCFHAKYITPTGETAWGDRFTQTPVHLLCLLGAPLLWTAASELRLRARAAALALIAWSVMQQIASLLLMLGVEEKQLDNFGVQWAIPQRFVNLWLVVAGQADTSPLFLGVPPEWRRISLLPFQLELRYPDVARWALAAWCLALVAALTLLARLLHRSPNRQSDG